MKKKIWSILLSLVLALCLLPATVLAATPTEIKIQADKTEAHPGDTITYTVTLGAVEELQSLNFQLSVPNGLTYVSGSGTVTDGLAATLGAAQADFTEETLCFIAYGGGSYDNEGTTTIMTFQCKVNDNSNGDLEVTFEDKPVLGNPAGGDIESTINTNAAKVQVTVPVTGITLDNTTLSLNIGDTKTLIPTVSPDNATNKNVVFSSENPSVAKVDPSTGLVTAVEKGKAVITATTEDGSKVASCEVTVSCGHAFKKQIDAKDSTCVDKGWDAYAECDQCGQLFKADGSAQIAEVPYRDLATHSYTERKKSAEHLKAAGTCKAEAVYYVSCAVCGDNGTDTFTGEKNLDNHANTTVLNRKAATCEEDGYSGDTKCLDCGEMVATGSVVEATGHSASDNWSYDAESHWKVCANDCGYVFEETEDVHSSTGANVATCTKKAVCDECGAEYGEKAPHSYDTTTWKRDVSGHWHACVCGDEIDFTQHTPDRTEPTETEAVRCSECDYVITPALGHTHVFDQKVAEESYLKAAADCKNAAVYYMSCTCGQASETLTFTSGQAKGHSVDVNTWKTDENIHWNECVCGERINSGEHRDTNGDNKCDNCAYRLSAEDVNQTTETTTQEVTSPKTGDERNILPFVCVILVSAAGVFGMTFYYENKKKKHNR